MTRLCLLAAACISMLAAAPVSVEMESGVFAARGWAAPVKAPAGGWASIFTVHTGVGKDVPPLLGEYAVRNGLLTFRPRFPLAPGLRIRAVFQSAEFYFDIPRAELVSRTKVERTYPGTKEIPENQLKFYLEFSGPMGRGDAWKHIHLLRSDGTEVELPFLEIEQEMWDAAGRRLTVLFDPGRIKRGVKPLEDIGPAIEAGHSYTLVVDREWRDASGAPLMQPYRRQFHVVAADRTPIDPAAWKIGTIRPGTREPLTIHFGEPLDAALALRLINVDQVPGTALLQGEEREWRFVPDQPWTSREYTLQIDTALEDLAGNKVGRPFDVDVFEQVERRVRREVISIPLRIGRE